MLLIEDLLLNDNHYVFLFSGNKQDEVLFDRTEMYRFATSAGIGIILFRFQY